MVKFRGQIINDASPYIGNPKSGTLGIRSTCILFIQVQYKNGAVDEPRSRNLRLGRALLCQLSYYRMEPHIRFERMTYGLQDRCSAS